MAVAERELPGATQNAGEDYQPQPYRWTRKQFYAMGDRGLFQGRRVILVAGEILAMPPIGPEHQSSNTLAGDALRAAFGDGFVIREQAPFDVGEATDPEPDVAVVPGQARDYVAAHPKKAALVVEISISTLAYDRGDKACLYAAAGVEDYWIVDPVGRQVEVHRRPVPDADAPFGARYAEVAIYTTGDVIAPLARSESHVAVADLLP